MADEAQDELAARVRERVAGRESREVAMFGSLAFMIDGAIAVAARRGGVLLVRIDPRQRDALLERPGVSAAFIGPSRSMTAGWVEVAAAQLAADEDLDFWVAMSVGPGPR